jgi:6-pyruvoyl-tetrahydropterin synthase
MSRGERFEAAHGVQIRVGSFHEDHRVTFAVCHGHNPGIVIDLASGKYDKVVMTVENAEEIAARLSSRS